MEEIIEIDGEWFCVHHDELDPNGNPLIVPIDPPGSPGP